MDLLQDAISFNAIVNVDVAQQRQLLLHVQNLRNYFTVCICCTFFSFCFLAKALGHAHILYLLSTSNNKLLSSKTFFTCDSQLRLPPKDFDNILIMLVFFTFAIELRCRQSPHVDATQSSVVFTMICECKSFLENSDEI
jgi:hypothetical protein